MLVAPLYVAVSAHSATPSAHLRVAARLRAPGGRRFRLAPRAPLSEPAMVRSASIDGASAAHIR